MGHDARILPWRVTDSKTLLRDRWIDVRGDACVTARGVDVAPYYVLGYPDWVHVLAIDDADRIVLVTQYRHALGGPSTELPGGAVDAGDTDIIAAGRRELVEETGYAAATFELVARLSPNPATHANRVHILLARGAFKAGNAQPEPSEDLVVDLLPRQGVVDLALSGGMINAVHVGLLMIGLRALDQAR